MIPKKEPGRGFFLTGSGCDFRRRHGAKVRKKEGEKEDQETRWIRVGLRYQMATASECLQEKGT